LRRNQLLAIVVVVVVLLIATSVLFTRQFHNPTPPSGSWAQTSGYLGPVSDASCVDYGQHIYCVGNDGSGASSAEFAQLSASGVSLWAHTNAIPIPTTLEPSCVVYNGYIDCVARASTGSLEKLWYASLSPAGIGTWSSSPISFSGGAGPRCVVYSGWIYCVGFDPMGNGAIVVYYALLSSTGGVTVTGGYWQEGGAYAPGFAILSGFEAHSCVVHSGYLTCVGGYTSANPTSPGAWDPGVFYYQLSPSGGIIAGPFSTTSYPFHPIFSSCVVYSTILFPPPTPYLYCIGGQQVTASNLIVSNAVYRAPLLSNGGVGGWSTSPTLQPYPVPIYSESCVSEFGVLFGGVIVYCVGGNDNNGLSTALVYYSVVG
jgi:hypothetical protein